MEYTSYALYINQWTPVPLPGPKFNVGMLHFSLSIMVVIPHYSGYQPSLQLVFFAASYTTSLWHHNTASFPKGSPWPKLLLVEAWMCHTEHPAMCCGHHLHLGTPLSDLLVLLVKRIFDAMIVDLDMGVVTSLFCPSCFRDSRGATRGCKQTQ